MLNVPCDNNVHHCIFRRIYLQSILEIRERGIHGAVHNSLVHINNSVQNGIRFEKTSIKTSESTNTHLNIVSTYFGKPVILSLVIVLGYGNDTRKLGYQRTSPDFTLVL
jgi:hypothetical protein